jgi:type III restriction enzyme
MFWVSELNALQSQVIYDFAFVDEAGFQSYRPKSFSQLFNGFKQYKASTV